MCKNLVYKVLVMLLLLAGVQAVQNKPMRVQVKKSIAQSHRVLINVTGTTVAARDVTLRAKMDGIVKKIHVNYGQRVQKGDLLVEFDEEDRQERLKEAESRIAQRQREYESGQKLLKKRVVPENEVIAQKAELHAAEARRAEILREIKDSKIIAPFEGVNESRDVEEGEVISSGDPIARVIELHPLQIDCFVSENDVFEIADQQGKDDVAFVRVKQGESYQPARITFVSKNADPRTRTYKVELEISNDDYRVPAGLTTSVRLVKQQIEAHQISLAAITLSDAGVPGVKVVKDTYVKFVPIEVIDTNADGSVWITGLDKEDLIITIGAGYVIDGQVVEPVQVESKQKQTGAQVESSL